jgi:hypothetical protein
MATLIDPLVLDAAIAWPCAAGVALILLLAALDKLRDLEQFTAVVAQYRILPGAGAAWAARAIPLAEICAAGLLLWPAARPAGATLAVALLLTFAAAIAVNLLRGRRDIDCGCGGLGGGQTLSWWLVLRNVVLAVLALAGAAEGTARTLTWLDLCTALAATLALLALYAAFNQLGANAPRLQALRRQG